MGTIKKNIIISLVIVFVFGIPLFSQFQPNPFGGSREPGIETEIKYEEGLILFKVSVAPDYHITDIKNNFFTVELEKNDYLEIGETLFPEGITYADEKVFKGNFVIKVFVKPQKEISQPQEFKFTVSYQICQEEPEELCYPPESQDVKITISRNFEQYIVGAITSEANRDKQPDESFGQWVERIIKQELEKKSLLLFLLVFLAGFLTSFTPCVYPVIPIVMGYVGTRSGNKKLKGLYLSIFFVLGLALVYSILGVIAATTGTMMGISFQNPIVVIVISSIFIIMGLSLAGLFDIPVPTSISSKMKSGHKSEIVGALLVGGVSGIIAAPCVGPVLIALLSWISQTGNIMLGFWLTFTFSLGLGVIFLLVGTFSGMVSALPKGGGWMDYFKYFFAVLLIGGGVYFLNFITAEWLGLLLWGIFLVSASIFMGLFKSLDDAEMKQKLFKVILVLLFLTGTLLFFKAMEMKYFPMAQVTSGPVEKAHLAWIGDLDEGKKVAKAENKVMMVDSYADWCVACKELDEYTFSDAQVAERLKEFVLIKLDFTKKDQVNEALRKSLGVIGMPTVIFLNPDGSELKRFAGFKKKAEFLKFLDNLK